MDDTSDTTSDGRYSHLADSARVSFVNYDGSQDIPSTK